MLYISIEMKAIDINRDKTRISGFSMFSRDSSELFDSTEVMIGQHSAFSGQCSEVPKC